MRERGGRPGGLLPRAHAEVSVLLREGIVSGLDFRCGSTESLADFMCRPMTSAVSQLWP